MADKKLQQLNNTRTSVFAGDQFAIGGADGFTYKAQLTVLQSFLLDSSLTASTIKAPQSAVVKTAIDAINTILTTDNASLDDFQKITDAIEAIQATLSVNDANYDTLQKITDKLKIAETKLATIATGAEVNVQADWNQTDNTNDAFINNKPTLGTASGKNVGKAIGNIQENGAALGNSQTVETDATGKFITATKNTAYNANFGTGNTDVARGDAAYSKAETYTQTEINNALAANSTDDRARANHTGEQAISTVTGLQTALDATEGTANKGVANGYASLDGNAKVPLSQLPANVKGSKVVADIATRDVIADGDRFEGLRVHVLDASADSTVTNASAGYILNSGLTNSDWEKTYESESLDIDLTDYFNKTIDTTDNLTEGTAKFTTQADINKLAGIEPNATADQTATEIKSAYESNADTNAFTDAEQTKLAGVEQNATADQTDAEIKTAYENNLDTNPFTDSEKTKLAGIDSEATANSTDAFLLDRANHAGTQTLATISDSGALAGKNTIATADVDNNAITTAKIEQVASKTVLGRTSASTGDVEEIAIATTLKADLNLTSTDVGLGDVDNTSDADKPVSTAQQTALDGKLAKASNLSDVDDRQTAINTLTDVANATNEYILTKDTTTGNAKWKPAPDGAGGTNLSIGATTGTTVDIDSDTGSNATIPAATPSNAGLMTSEDKTKLDGVELNATADQTAAEIKTAYESNADTNVFTDAEKTVIGNTSGTNTGDETTTSIQTKRPLKTINNQSLEGSGNIDFTKAHASAYCTDFFGSATTLAPLSGTKITNLSSGFTIGTSSITCNKAGVYEIHVAASVEPTSTISVPVTIDINGTPRAEGRYDSTITGTGFFANTALGMQIVLSNNDVITVSKDVASDAWVSIFVNIVEI